MSSFHGNGGHGIGLGGANGSGGGRGRGRGTRVLGSGKPGPELLDPQRERDGHRIMRLFTPYKGRLLGVIALIVFSSALGVVPPFLLRLVLARAIPQGNLTLLSELVGGMIAIAIATSALSVVQTYISTDIGQLKNLRPDLGKHHLRFRSRLITLVAVASR